MATSSHHDKSAVLSTTDTRLTRRDVLAVAAALGAVVTGPGAAFAAISQGQLTLGVHVSLAPTWFDPADTQAFITPFMVLYALHDAVMKPMPDKLYAPSLAESWSASIDHLTYEFVLREDLKFHNGERVTAEDVKFSFERYRGTSYQLMRDQVAAIETPDVRHVRFKLKKPWPDFLTFYSTASGAGWVVPKKYLEKVGEEGFKKHPIGAGPYKFVSFTPGIELVLEAFDEYWRKIPAVKRIVMKVIEDESTRFAALKGGELDIAYSIRSELAEAIQRKPGLSIKSVVVQAPFWIYFPEQWDPKSPWYDLRVRQAANLAIDREEMNKALFLGSCKTTNSIIPESFEYYWQPPPAVYDPVKAKKLLGAAGFANGFDVGPFYCDISFSNIGEAAANYFQEVGIVASCCQSSGAPLPRPLPASSTTVGSYLRGAAPSATRQRGLLPSLSRTAPTSTAAIPISTNSTRSRSTNSTRRRGLPSSKRCSGWCTRKRSTRRSGYWRSSTVLAPGSESRLSAGSPAFPMQRLSRTSRSSRCEQQQNAGLTSANGTLTRVVSQFEL
jgi:peptide/nickel transport system substrate-binding protein